jgi:2-iminobutanoate/2-iminopropanoate deaminase
MSGGSMARETFEAIEGQQAHFGYAQAVRVGDTIWIAGTPGCDDNLTFPEDMVGQLRQVYENLTTTIEHFGGSLDDLVDLTVFVSDVGAYTEAAAQLRGDYFGLSGLPASSLVQVSGFLLPQMLVLIKATAVIGSA